MNKPTLDVIPTVRRVWDAKQAALIPIANSATAKPAPFLSGVVPLDWLAQAHRLGGQCLAVGLLLWHLHNATKQRVVWVAKSVRARFSLSERTYWEALRRLEVAGLVVVERRPGRALQVEIRQANSTPSYPPNM